MKLGVTLWHHYLRVKQGKETCVDGIQLNNSASSHGRDAEPNLSDTIILGQEIGPVPVNNLHRVFLFRTNIEFVEDHHPLVLEVVQRPFLRLYCLKLLFS